VREDVVAESLDEKLTQLADTRMPVGGELCPVDLLAAEDCEEQVRAALNRLRLDERPHVSLYSSAA
jgi:demethoxyubiquinone hydroxylase (CLK1/Coq7/Cat5 family)